MRVRIEGFDLPGRDFCDASGEPRVDVRVGVQIRREVRDLVPADAESATWELDPTLVTTPEGGLDFKGPEVHGKRGDRFLYLAWGSVDDGGDFQMFRRAKLMLNRIDPAIVRSAEDSDWALVARVRMSDDHGAPRCARVDPPDIDWRVADA